MNWDHNPKRAPATLDLVQDFVNTRNYLRGGELLRDAEVACSWLAGRGLVGSDERIGESGRRRLVAFREGLRGLLLAHNGGGAPDVEAINGLAAPAVLAVGFGPDGRPGLVPGAGGDPVDRVVARLLVEVLGAKAEGRWGRLKACRNEGCRWAFYDASKNRSGSWCDMDVCGARHKMRAYRRRKGGEA